MEVKIDEDLISRVLTETGSHEVWRFTSKVWPIAVIITERRTTQTSFFRNEQGKYCEEVTVRELWVYNRMLVNEFRKYVRYSYSNNCSISYIINDANLVLHNLKIDT